MTLFFLILAFVQFFISLYYFFKEKRLRKLFNESCSFIAKQKNDNEKLTDQIYELEYKIKEDSKIVQDALHNDNKWFTKHSESIHKLRLIRNDIELSQNKLKDIYESLDLVIRS